MATFTARGGEGCACRFTIGFTKQNSRSIVVFIYDDRIASISVVIPILVYDDRLVVITIAISVPIDDNCLGTVPIAIPVAVRTDCDANGPDAYSDDFFRTGGHGTANACCDRDDDCETYHLNTPVTVKLCSSNLGQR
ncbi:MAG: hypothetical protein ACXWKC_10580 [Xanthobacteraceae bacterium]